MEENRGIRPLFRANRWRYSPVRCNICLAVKPAARLPLAWWMRRRLRSKDAAFFTLSVTLRIIESGEPCCWAWWNLIYTGNRLLWREGGRERERERERERNGGKLRSGGFWIKITEESRIGEIFFENFFFKTNIMNNSCTVGKIIREIFPKKISRRNLLFILEYYIENRNFE